MFFVAASDFHLNTRIDCKFVSSKRTIANNDCSGKNKTAFFHIGYISDNERESQMAKTTQLSNSNQLYSYWHCCSFSLIVQCVRFIFCHFKSKKFCSVCCWSFLFLDHTYSPCILFVFKFQKVTSVGDNIWFGSYHSNK